MNVLNRLIVAALPAIPKPVVRQFANRYIAGEDIADALRVVQELNALHAMATLDVLGEDSRSRDEAIISQAKIVELFDAITRERLQANVSIKLTQLGLKLDRHFCLDTTRVILDHARQLGNFVRIDMEDSSCTDDTLWVYRALSRDFPNVGVVLQAYLRRTMKDAQSLIGEGLKNFRLCKGIYVEPEEIAFKTHGEINRNFIDVLRYMLQQNAYVGIATHDDELVRSASAMVEELNVGHSEYEFQMLLGVRQELRNAILRDRHKLRIYVPFGKQWYQYSIRRFKENPQIAGYVLKALFSRNQLN